MMDDLFLRWATIALNRLPKSYLIREDTMKKRIMMLSIVLVVLFLWIHRSAAGTVIEQQVKDREERADASHSLLFGKSASHRSSRERTDDDPGLQERSDHPDRSPFQELSFNEALPMGKGDGDAAQKKQSFRPAQGEDHHGKKLWRNGYDQRL